jgi:hypothetical protein
MPLVPGWVAGELAKLEKDAANSPVRVTVTTNGREKKKTASRLLDDLIADNLREKPFLYQGCGAYRFNFAKRSFFWRDRELHITANEALFLYRWLILNDGSRSVQSHFLRNMRRRLGTEFLAEVPHGAS